MRENFHACKLPPRNITHTDTAITLRMIRDCDLLAWSACSARDTRDQDEAARAALFISRFVRRSGGVTLIHKQSEQLEAESLRTIGVKRLGVCRAEVHGEI